MYGVAVLFFSCRTASGRLPNGREARTARTTVERQIVPRHLTIFLIDASCLKAGVDPGNIAANLLLQEVPDNREACWTGSHHHRGTSRCAAHSADK